MAAGRSSNESSGDAGGQVLVLNHDPASSRWFDQTLRMQGHRVTIAWDAETALMVYELERETITAVVINMQMPNEEGATTLRSLLQMDPGAKVIVFGTTPGFNLRGTVAALPLPLDNRTLELAIQMAGARKRPSIPPPPR